MKHVITSQIMYFGMTSLSKWYNKERRARKTKPGPLHHLLLPTVSQIKTSVGTAATGHEKCIISGCSALPGSLRRLQWRKMLRRDGWALFLEICLNRSQVFNCSMRGCWLEWASYSRLNGCLSALGPIGTLARHDSRRQCLSPKKCNLECLASSKRPMGDDCHYYFWWCVLLGAQRDSV